MLHIDLFSGIGGFALAVDEVFPGTEHIFCEIDPYCQALLKKRFKGAKVYGDIRTLSRERLTADTNGNGFTRGRTEINTAEAGLETLGNAEERDGVAADTDSRRQAKQELEATGDKQCDRGATPDSPSGKSGVEETRDGREDTGRGSEECFILTGGFPCQPFSQAGKRKGTDDNRYLWPEMLRVIRDFKPTWVIAENVRGLLTIEQGMVFEQVCLDLEGEGYEVQAFVIPAVAVNAPHRRDRVWFVANRRCTYGQGATHSGEAAREIQCEEAATELERPDTDENNAPDTKHRRLERREGKCDNGMRCGGRENKAWEQNWLEVATELCGVDDGLPAELDGLKLSKSRHRVERLKALGNAIVPQVAIEIMRAIKQTGGKHNEYGK